MGVVNLAALIDVLRTTTKKLVSFLRCTPEKILATPMTLVLPCISQLPNLFIGTPRICNLILLFIVWVRSFSKMLSSVKFEEDKVLVFVILREKC